MVIRGSCLCGGVTFEIDRACGPVEFCHCNRCRKVSGSASLLTVRVNTSDFRFLTGRELIRSYAAPILYSPPAYTSTFCSKCGSPVPTPDPEGESFEIAAGVFDDDFQVRPDKHIFVEFVPPWDTLNDNLPAYTVRELYKLRTGHDLPGNFELKSHTDVTMTGLPDPRVQPGRGRVVTVEARPSTMAMDTSQAALIVVDMQNDFGAEGGMLHRAGIDISGIRRVVAPTADAIEVARRGGIKIVYLKMAYRPDLSDLGPPDSVNAARHLHLGVGDEVLAPDGTESRILIRDTWSTQILEELEPHAEDLVLYKTRFSGFYDTDLHDRLQALGVKYLIFTGCTTSICVESTVRDAMFRDYMCLLLEDCMSEPIGHGLSRSNHDASLLAVEALLGWVSDSRRFANALRA